MSEERLSQTWEEHVGDQPRCGGMTYGVGSLTLLPLPLQEAVVREVLLLRPQRATDLWHEDEASGTVFVLGRGMQWHLNRTAAFVWREPGTSVDRIVQNLCKEHRSTDRKEIEASVVEFLLQASSYGLVDLYPEQDIEQKP